MDFRYFSKNGELLPLKDATISLQNINYQYGFGVYESLRVRNDILYFAKRHTERLLHSASLIGLDHEFQREQIQSYIEALVKKNEIQSCNIKMLLIGGRTPEDSLLFILPLAPLFPDRKLYSHGASVQTTHFERFMPNAKTLNMLPSYLAYTKAKKNGHYDALLIAADGTLHEGTRTNFFVIKGTTVITPPKEVVLEGVVRQSVMMVARRNGFSIKEESIPLTSLADFDCAFLTSTSSKIIPLMHIDDFYFKEIPQKLKELMKLYDHFLEESKGVFPE